MKERQLVENVWAFMDKTAALVGRMESDRFSQEMHANCLELGLQSPIEDMFWIACHALCKAEFMEVNPGPEYDKNGELESGYGVFIKPQAKIGAYRVDFEIQQHGIGPKEFLSPVVVELDGHDFHDKDKRQRSYEKARDRFLVKSGYKVLHFTGSDVVADPFKVAFEALSIIGLYCNSGVTEYDPTDPFGSGH